LRAWPVKPLRHRSGYVMNAVHFACIEREAGVKQRVPRLSQHASAGLMQIKRAGLLINQIDPKSGKSGKSGASLPRCTN